MADIDLTTVPVPLWLDPKKEIKQSGQPQVYEALDNEKKAVAFILLSFKALEESGNGRFQMNAKQLLAVVGNSVSETGWGKTWKGWNFGGWKINPQVALEWKRMNNGECPLWWKAEGHVASGDQPVVYYRGFANPTDFYTRWMERFCPRTTDTKHRYYKCGKLFWEHDWTITHETQGIVHSDLNIEQWFRELCLAGYKGPVTEASPDASVAAFVSIVKRIMCVFCQHMLGLTPDGVWGPRSRILAQTWSHANGYTKETGDLTTDLFLALYDKWYSVQHMKQIVDLSL